MGEVDWVADAWVCSACGKLIYAIYWDQETGLPYPRAGAPAPNELNSDFPQVCTLCLTLHMILRARDAITKTDYWTKLHNRWKKENGRLSSGGDYLKGGSD